MSARVGSAMANTTGGPARPTNPSITCCPARRNDRVAEAPRRALGGAPSVLATTGIIAAASPGTRRRPGQEPGAGYEPGREHRESAVPSHERATISRVRAGRILPTLGARAPAIATAQPVADVVPDDRRQYADRNHGRQISIRPAGSRRGRTVSSRDRQAEVPEDHRGEDCRDSASARGARSESGIAWSLMGRRAPGGWTPRAADRAAQAWRERLSGQASR